MIQGNRGWRSYDRRESRAYQNRRAMLPVRTTMAAAAVAKKLKEDIRIFLSPAPPPPGRRRHRLLRLTNSTLVQY